MKGWVKRKNEEEDYSSSLIAFSGSISRIENLSIGEECNESNIEATTPADVENPFSRLSFPDVSISFYATSVAQVALEKTSQAHRRCLKKRNTVLRLIDIDIYLIDYNDAFN